MLESAAMNIALLRLSAMGDVVLCVPTVRTLQARYPDAKITWITSPAMYTILKDLSGVEFVVIEKPNNIKDYWALYKKLKPYRFDVLLCMQASFRANIVYPLIKAKRRIGFDKKVTRELHRFFIKESISGERGHLLDIFMRFAEMLDCHEKKYDWDLAISTADEAWADGHLSIGKRVLAINPAASKQERCWLTERYIKVIQEAKQRWDVNIVLTGGPSAFEKELGLSIEKNINFPITNLIGKTTPKQLAVLLKKVNVLLSPDTGPLHIAVAMGTPVVGLYAVAPSTLSGPYFSKALTIDKYSEAVQIFLKKSVDEVASYTRVHTQEAMGLIQVDEVLDKLEQVFSQESK